MTVFFDPANTRELFVRVPYSLCRDIISSGAKGILADPVQNFFLQRYEQAYKHEIEQFAAWIASGENPSPNMFDGLQAQRLADAATEACFSGKIIRL